MSKEIHGEREYINAPKMRDIHINETHRHGDMSLCNLASINLVVWRSLDEEGKKRLAKVTVKSLDDAITNGVCPIPEGKITNDLYRYVGIGILNAANAMAKEKIVIDSPEAAEWFGEVMEDLSYHLISASVDLAVERGPFKGFEDTKWAKGLTPVHESRRVFPQAWDLTEFGKNFEANGYLEKWDKLGERIRRHGIRNAQVLAIAPTANSGKAINATESTEPVHALVFKEEGMFTVMSLAPNIRENMAYYKPAFECDQKALVTNAIVRQCFLDQAQSITLYYKKVDSLKAMTEIHNYGFKHGIKTFYYLKQNKEINAGDDCVACAV